MQIIPEARFSEDSPQRKVDICIWLLAMAIGHLKWALEARSWCYLCVLVMTIGNHAG